MKIAGFKGTDVIAGMFRRMFQPVPSITKQIVFVANEHGLIPGKYAGVHIRARFPVSNQKKIKTRKRNADAEGGGIVMEDPETYELVSGIANNAMNCAMQIMSNTTRLYLASDSVEPIHYITQQSKWKKKENRTTKTRYRNYGQKALVDIPKVATRKDTDMEPKHFNFQSGEVEEFSGVFVDQWILGHSKCISHGAGGFGMFVSALTGNYDPVEFATEKRTVPHKSVQIILVVQSR
eukprot:CAMPEP_0181038916 /NCGR_PEP_ID=MMETSP1070-20121207/10184_1 /TAXON_ID=265543 /ORGANISM="Minutocellus polymorphus, Strain NH13" /LENGTH=235 /DNA_ID=CAMNT_0023116719 /DNA_START=919 /DNA_END=1627 /DNA_ORIENTATION=+